MKLSSKVDGYIGPVGSTTPTTILEDTFTAVNLGYACFLCSGMTADDAGHYVNINGTHLTAVVGAPVDPTTEFSINGNPPSDMDNLIACINLNPTLQASGISVVARTQNYSANGTVLPLYSQIHAFTISSTIPSITTVAQSFIDATKWTLPILTINGTLPKTLSGKVKLIGGVDDILLAKDLVPAGSRVTMDVTFSNLPEGGNEMDAFILQQDTPNFLEMAFSILVVGGVVTQVYLRIYSSSFAGNGQTIPLSFCTVSGNSVTIPSLCVTPEPGMVTVSVGGHFVETLTDPTFSTVDGKLYIYNTSAESWDKTYDNILIENPHPAAWKALQNNPPPGLIVIGGLTTEAPIDSKGHGHAEDIIPTGTNFAVIVVQKYSSPQNIDGKKSLKALEDAGQDWDKIDDKLGGLIWFGALTDAAKKKYSKLIDSYNDQFAG